MEVLTDRNQFHQRSRCLSSLCFYYNSRSVFLASISFADLSRSPSTYGCWKNQSTHDSLLGIPLLPTAPNSYKVFPAVVTTLLWIDEADAAATIFVFPWNKVKMSVLLKLNAPELDKLLETQFRPKYDPHFDTSAARDVKRRTFGRGVPTITGQFTK